VPERGRRIAAALAKRLHQPSLVSLNDPQHHVRPEVCHESGKRLTACNFGYHHSPCVFSGWSSEWHARRGRSSSASQNATG
jgi:hypothetical protein